MIKKLLLSYSGWFLPRWLVLLKDVIIVTISFLFAYSLRYNFQLTDTIRTDMYGQLYVLILIAFGAFLLTGLYKGIIRHTGYRDVMMVGFAIGIISCAMLLTNLFYSFGILTDILTHIPYAVIIIFVAMACTLLVLTRLGVRLVYHWLKANKNTVNVMIYGAGAAGLITRTVLEADESNPMEVIGFLDDDPGKIGKSIQGIPVYSTWALNPKFLTGKNVNEIIFSIQNIDKDLKRERIEELLSKTNVRVKDVPPVDAWINGELSAKQIRQVKITDLLQRSEIHLDNAKVLTQVENKRVMVTGAAGSIGSEIVRQLCHFHTQQLIMVDQAETPLYDLELELRKDFPDQQKNFKFIIANVGDPELMEKIFADYRPEIIYHAAAYKHVPMMEHNPFEAIRVNIFGTMNLADLANKYQTERFVMISTDKAVNPTNVMGATKRAAEIYIQSLNHSISNRTRFITTRFGNVLGSNGSVIPLFERQIAAGGPVTVTHPDITRYFMTIPEACQLVLEAGSMGNGGEIFMFDMGKPVRITDLAFNMIRLSGLEPGKDIKIVYTGLRHGEKLYEELLYDKEKGQPTYHPKIAIAKVSYCRLSEVQNMLNELKRSISTRDKMILVETLKQMVPEFKSNNSIYQELDEVSRVN